MLYLCFINLDDEEGIVLEKDFMFIYDYLSFSFLSKNLITSYVIHLQNAH